MSQTYAILIPKVLICSYLFTSSSTQLHIHPIFFFSLFLSLFFVQLKGQLHIESQLPPGTAHLPVTI